MGFLKTIWFFGLSGSGKTTLSLEMVRFFKNTGHRTILLDGDLLRNGLNNNLGYSPEDRKENVRRIAEVCKILLDSGVIPIVAAITPYDSDRDMIRNILSEEKLIFIYVKCSLVECENRDPKGLYARARSGDLENFTGVSDTFEEPTSSVYHVSTEYNSIQDSVRIVMDLIAK